MTVGTFYMVGTGEGGYILSRDIVYLTAQAGAGTVSPQLNGTTFVIGQRLNGANFDLTQAFARWDTSSITAGGSITAAVVSLYGDTDSSDTNYTINARNYLWTPSPIDATTWRTTYTDTLCATFATASFATGAYNDFTESGSALQAAVNKTGLTYLYFLSSRLEAGNIPIGEERVIVRGAVSSSGLEPKLTVTYTAGVTFVPVQSEPVPSRKKSAVSRLGWSVTSILGQLEVQSVDKWLGFTDPRPGSRRVPTRTGSFAVDPQSLTIGDPVFNGHAYYEPVPARRRQPVRTGLVVVDPYSLQEEPQIGKWSVVDQPRINKRRAAFWQGLMVTDPPAAEPSTQFGHAYYEPVPNRRRKAFWQGWYTIDPQALKRDIGVDAWIGFHEPVPNKRRDIRLHLGFWAADWTSTLFSPPFLGESYIVDYPDYNTTTDYVVYSTQDNYTIYTAVRVLRGNPN